ncbi:MAG: hemolysin family protein [Alphaproteobacteria bacterium]|nr:hemolysin family protein [Alphaproteobacteria bacterium]MBU0792537.1 hemolysin family protein [Alphaproteobacteria bacterium]MBU0877094.1 hemolysin family protein [Alphaproteobacteria bacterium]MBU1770203.1 hemolysin family protein [Alphaproteobacteria bacterium]
MPPFPWLDAAIVLALIALNGVFAMSELAIVSARKPRLESMARAGKHGARAAMGLSMDPGRFLSTVQIGITLIGILAGAYSGDKLGGPLGAIFASLGVTPNIAENAGFAVAIVATTYVSLIIGELVPKQLALRNPEPLACFVAPFMIMLARIAAPVVWVLDQSSELIFKLMRLKREGSDHVTAEELQLIVAEASRHGVIEESERAIISGVVRLADRPVREVMTPRRDIDWLDADADPSELREKLLATPHTRLPVAQGSVEDIIGVVQARDVMSALFRGEALDLRVLMRPVSIVPDQVDAMDALNRLREADVPMVMVHDEYGHFEGIVTPADLMSAIAGEFASDSDLYTQPMVTEREDGSLLVSGQMAIDALAERIDLDLSEDRDYATVAGFALAVLRRLPEEGEFFSEQGWRFEIVDMDGRKIDKLLVSAEA